jgi:glycine betaine/proline transport system substrate-binding protein
MKKALIRPLLLALGLLLSGAAQAEDGKTIRIGWTAWSDAEVVTKLAARLLEERLGLEVDLILLDIGLQYQGLAAGDLDAMLMAWLPKTHEAYMDKVGDALVNLGPIYTRARLGWVVPDYVPKEELSSLEDLRDPAVQRRIGRKIQGIDPGAGLMQASERALEAYDLDRLRLVSASGAAMTAALARAIRREEWIVVTGWSPHWMFSEWDLRYLDDPKGALGARERVHVLVREGFYQEFNPQVTEFLARMYLPLEELEAIMADAQQTSYEEAVQRYIDSHEARVYYWITGNFL